MSAGQAAGGFARVVHERGVRVAGVDRMRLAVAADEHLVRLFLLPSSAPLVPSISMNRSFSRPWLICEAVTRAQRAVLEADHGVAVVVELAAGLEDLQVATDRLGQQAGHVAGQVVGVRADVAEAAGRAALGRIGAPGGLLLVFAFQPGAQPALDVVDANGVDLAQFAARGSSAAPAAPADSRCSCARRRTRRPSWSTAAASSSACFRSNVIGLSQMTLKPASTAALAISKCVWLGVATVTKSIRSSAGSFSLAVEQLGVRAIGPLGGMS